MSFEKIQYKGYKIEIYQDMDAPDPRKEWDNFGLMVTTHSRYELGDVQIGSKRFVENKPYFHDVDEFYAFMKRQKKGIFLPLYLYDHSGITIRTSSVEFRAVDSAGWDWGLLGYIYATGDMIKKEFGVKTITNEILDKAKKILMSEVEAYDQYLTGDVWGYRIYAPPPGYLYDEDYDEFVNEDGEEFFGTWDDEVDSLWGMFGYSYCLQEAKDYVDWHIKDTAKKEAERVNKIEVNHELLFHQLEGVGL